MINGTPTATHDINLERTAHWDLYWRESKLAREIAHDQV